ncbi:MAG TPA: heavy metal-responsive transcriptional regulator [Solirubrobacterales bacterium]|nr:heavy metal-responsive transcriptional regulator [Solirubrobacterales bacterium]
MRIGEVSNASGVPAKTIRYWESERLLAPPARTRSGYRDYASDVIDRLEFIRHAQAGGLALSQIREVLSIGDSGEPPCEHVRALVKDRLAEVEARIAELTRTRCHLERLALRAASQDPADCRGYCTIITG